MGGISLPYNEVKDYIENVDGYKLLSDSYKNNYTKLYIQCPDNHIFKMRFGSFKSGCRCPECSKKVRSIKNTLSYAHVKNYIENVDGYKLLSDSYKNNRTKLKIKCPDNHIFEMIFNAFTDGQKCPKCANINRSQSYKNKYSDVKKYIENNNHYLISSSYINATTKLKIKCPDNHIFEMTWNGFQSGNRCSECAGNKKYTNKEIIEKIKTYHNINETDDEKLQVNCKYCGKIYVASRKSLINRILYIEGRINQENNLYCSDNCRKECPNYNQKSYPKGFKPATSREVQPQLRKLAFERDNYTCQKCDIHQDNLETGLHCHHIDAVINNPIESADIDNCITLCKKCHKQVHKIPGCGYHELRCSNDKEK